MIIYNWNEKYTYLIKRNFYNIIQENYLQNQNNNLYKV